MPDDPLAPEILHRALVDARARFGSPADIALDVVVVVSPPDERLRRIRVKLTADEIRPPLVAHFAGERQRAWREFRNPVLKRYGGLERASLTEVLDLEIVFTAAALVSARRVPPPLSEPARRARIRARAAREREPAFRGRRRIGRLRRPRR